jgi:hypothetical protein
MGPCALGLSGACRLGVAIAAALLLSASASAATVPRWRVQTARRGQGGLLSVSCDRVACMTTGGTSSPVSPRLFALVQRGGDVRWKRTGSLSGDGSVSCRGRSCTTIGSSKPFSPLIAERWNGRRWTPQSVVNPEATFPGNSIESVSCGSRHQCMAAGSSEVGTTVDCPPDPVIPQCVTRAPLLEQWNGEDWQLEQVPLPAEPVAMLPRSGSGPSVGFDSVSCSSANACMVVGDWDLNNASDSSAASEVHLFADRWDGRTWTLLSLPSPRNLPSGPTETVSCASADACMMVGSDGQVTQHPFAERWNGRQWTLVPPLTPAGASDALLLGVSCPTVSSCTAVGVSGPAPLIERWNGAHWKLGHGAIPSLPGRGRAKAEPLAQLNGVSCTSPTSCVAVGDYYPSRNAPVSRQGWFIERYSAGRRR